MIEAGEVGAVFMVKDEASVVLQRLARQFRELDDLVLKTKASLKALGVTSLGTLQERLGGVGKELTGIGDKSKVSTDIMASAFGRADAAVNTTIERVGVLRKELGGLASQSRAVALIAGGGGGGAPPVMRNRVAGGHGGGAHISNINGMPLGGGYHIRGGSMPALGAAGALAYGAYAQAEMEDAIFQLSYHTGLKETPENVKMFRGILQGSLWNPGFRFRRLLRLRRPKPACSRARPATASKSCRKCCARRRSKRNSKALRLKSRCNRLSASRT